MTTTPPRPLLQYSDAELVFALRFGKRTLPTVSRTTEHGEDVVEVVDMPFSREELLNELAYRPWVRTDCVRALVRGRLYRNTMIYTLPNNTAYILGTCEQEPQYDFANESEAEAFVDACLEMSGRLIGALA